jgi:hypothetical protein
MASDYARGGVCLRGVVRAQHDQHAAGSELLAEGCGGYHSAKPPSACRSTGERQR